MKPTYKGFEAKKSDGFVSLPPVGAYVAEIKEVRVVEQFEHQFIEMMMDITEGEYKGRFVDVWNANRERFGDNAKFKGIFRMRIPVENDEEWVRRTFEGNLWCVQESNPGYAWDWDEKKLKGKKVGINLRKRLYTYTNAQGETKDGETVEIGKFETIDDVRNGKCKPMRDRDTRQKRDADDSPDSTDGSNFTDVSESVPVPW